MSKLKDKETFFHCIKCGEEHCKIRMRRTDSGYFCKPCYRQKVKNKRDFLLHVVAGVRRRTDILEEARMRREARKEIIFKPKILKGKQLHTPKVSTLGFYLTKTERIVLYRKYISKGFSEDEAKERLDNAIKYLNELIIKLRNNKKSELEINKKFKEEFAKLMDNKE